uniref:Uncharacterized protein n=1 Tax=Rhizophora mucronata TaxID=61149 RepID=A0A2P2QIE3_RHIMU
MKQEAINNMKTLNNDDNNYARN